MWTLAERNLRNFIIDRVIIFIWICFWLFSFLLRLIYYYIIDRNFCKKEWLHLLVNFWGTVASKFLENWFSVNFKLLSLNWKSIKWIFKKLKFYIWKERKIIYFKVYLYIIFLIKHNKNNNGIYKTITNHNRCIFPSPLQG